MIVGQSRPVSGTELWGLIGLIVRDLFDFFSVGLPGCLCGAGNLRACRGSWVLESIKLSLIRLVQRGGVDINGNRCLESSNFSTARDLTPCATAKRLVMKGAVIDS